MSRPDKQDRFTYKRGSQASEEGIVGPFSEQCSGRSSDVAHAGVHCNAQPQRVQGVGDLHASSPCPCESCRQAASTVRCLLTTSMSMLCITLHLCSEPAVLSALVHERCSGLAD